MKYLYVLFFCLIFTNCYMYQVDVNDNLDGVSNITKDIKPKGLYRIKVDNEYYKIKAVNWEKDTLVANINFKENELRKFHKKDIKEVQHRVFSRGRSDALTFGIYGGIAAIIILLIGK